MDKAAEAMEILKQYDQEHVIDLLNKLDQEKRQELLEQINKIDFHQIAELYENTKKAYIDALARADALQDYDELYEIVFRLIFRSYVELNLRQE